MHYKTEQEKQDKEFEKEFNEKFPECTHCGEIKEEFNVQVNVKDFICSIIKQRDQALLEAFKKDVGEITDKLPKLKEYSPISRDEYEKREIEGKRMWNSAIQETQKVLSLLKGGYGGGFLLVYT